VGEFRHAVGEIGRGVERLQGVLAVLDLPGLDGQAERFPRIAVEQVRLRVAIPLAARGDEHLVDTILELAIELLGRKDDPIGADGRPGQDAADFFGDTDGCCHAGVIAPVWGRATTPGHHTVSESRSAVTWICWRSSSTSTRVGIMAKRWPPRRTSIRRR